MNGLTVGEVAWYGAIVATLTFVFNVWKWMRESARLKIRIVPTIYHDGGYSKIEKTEHGEQMTPILYYHVEVFNVGERPTTIMGVAATTKRLGLLEWIRPPSSALPRGGTMGYSAGAFTPHDGKKLPHVIGPGEAWSCRVKEENIDSLRRAGIPKLEVHATCWRGSRMVRFPKAETESIAIVA